MPGANCSFPECSVSRRRKYHGIAIFQIPRRKDDFHKYVERRSITRVQANITIKYFNNNDFFKNQNNI